MTDSAPLPSTEGAEGAPARVTEDFRSVRRRTEQLLAPLAVEDYGVQPMADASPPKWHLAHTTWFFETFVLGPFAARYEPFDARYEYLFNSYYNGIGAQFPRPCRGRLSRPTVAEIRAYRERVDAAVEGLLANLPGDAAEEILRRIVLGLHHEEQHQELIVTDLKCNLGQNPLAPVYEAASMPPPGRAAAMRFTGFEGGVVEIGTDPLHAPGNRHAFAFDNETPRHRVYLAPFRLAERLVTCGEYLEFMADDGYRRPELWLADAWAHLQGMAEPWRAPMYWYRDGDVWLEYTLGGAREVDPAAPVVHVSFYEADAFARWAGCRLPRESEWEHAVGSAGGREAEGAWLESGTFHPKPDPGGRGLRQLFGDVWEWTASSYGPYPGFRPFAGALGEYNGKFMCNQVVLRGGSCATPRAHIRASYRNFFYPPDRWQFSGIRLATDA